MFTLQARSAHPAPGTCPVTGSLPPPSPSLPSSAVPYPPAPGPPTQSLSAGEGACRPGGLHPAKGPCVVPGPGAAEQTSPTWPRHCCYCRLLHGPGWPPPPLCAGVRSSARLHPHLSEYLELALHSPAQGLRTQRGRRERGSGHPEAGVSCFLFAQSPRPASLPARDLLAHAVGATQARVDIFREKERYFFRQSPQLAVL